MKPVFLYQRYLPHYRIPVYEKIDTALGGRLVVCHGEPPDGTGHLTTGESGFQRVRIENRSVPGANFVWQDFRAPFRRFGEPAAVIAQLSFRLLSVPALVAYCRLRSIPVGFWNHASSRRRDLSSSYDPRDLLFGAAARFGGAYICYSEDDRRQMARFVEEDRLFVATNTVDTGPLFQERRRLERIGVEAVRRELGIERRRVIAFLGRLIPEKRPGEVLSLAGVLRDEGIETSVVMIGDGPCREDLERSVTDLSLPEVRFGGAVGDPRELCRLLFASDAVVIPGYLGLAVNHALCSGTPVVSRARGPDGPHHSPEAEHVVQGETGYLLEGDFLAGASRALRTIFEERDAFRERCASYAERYLEVSRLVGGVVAAVRRLEDGWRTKRGNQP